MRALPTLYSDEEFGKLFAAALGRVAARSINTFTVVIEGHNDDEDKLPRSSGIGGCARAQFHRLLGKPVTDPNPASQNWSSMQGWYAQELVGEVLREMGYEVRLPATPEHTLTSGHLDFEVRGLDLGDEWVVVDVKQRNVFGAKKLVREGIDHEMKCQMQDYMAKTGAKRAMVVMVPYDLSTWKLETKKYKLEELVPEPLVHRLFEAADPKLQLRIQDRARGLLTAKALGLVVNREFDPGFDKFPCGWCETRTWCMRDDLRTSIDPELLFVVPSVEDVDATDAPHAE